MINYCLALPYLPGGIEIAKRFAQDEEKEKEVLAIDTDNYPLAPIVLRKYNIKKSGYQENMPTCFNIYFWNCMKCSILLELYEI
jgi:hypothetical protein